MRSPFLGPGYVSQSTNVADQECINLYPEIVDTHTGKQVGSLLMCPGLDLLGTAGAGPIRGMVANAAGSIMYLVSGTAVYSINAAYVATSIGTVAGGSLPVLFMKNNRQVVLLDTIHAYLLPPGQPLTGGTVGAAGTGYVVGDIITLIANDGVTVGTAQLTVATLTGSGVATFTISASGSFSTAPTGFTQASTSGSGSGFTLTAPTFGATAIYQIPLPFSGVPLFCAYQDNFGLLIENGTEKLWQSLAGDLSIWPPLNFASADAQPGYLFSIASLNDQIWALKAGHTEIWVNAGLNGFAFQRLAGTLIEHGILALYSLTTVGDSLACLSSDEDGNGVVVLSNGYTWTRISTHALEYAISQYPFPGLAVGYSYQQNGHLFYALFFPGDTNAFWVYDATASAQLKIPCWHQRCAFSNGAFGRHWSNCFVNFNGRLTVGDYRNGNLYAFNVNTQTDNGTQRKWVRSWRAFQQPIDKPVRFPPLFIDMETGINVPDGTDPQVVLEWSDDGGHNWSDQYFRPAGKPGQTAHRVKFTRIGSTRRATGLDRIFRLSSTDRFKVSLIGAVLGDE